MREIFSAVLDDGRRAVICHSTRGDGDLSPSAVAAAELTERRRAASGSGVWHAVHQVHGAEVVHVGPSSSADARPQADALLTNVTDRTLAVHSGDCVLVGLAHQAGAVAVAHAGWKGLRAGVLDAVVDGLRESCGSGSIRAVVGPHIRAGNYEFGTDDLAALAKRFGDHVVSQTADGSPALDLTAAIAHELDRLETTLEWMSPDCTAERSDQYWSHRARQETGRIALTARLESGQTASRER